MSPSIRIAVFALLALPLNACTGEITEPDDAIDGALLSLDADDGSTVTFYEHDLGVVTVRVSGEAESPSNTELRERIASTDSLAGAFRVLRPTDSVPAALLEADQRAAERGADMPDSSEAPGEQGRTADAPAVYSPDYFGDNYGASWFLDRYCRIAPGRWCGTNTDYVYSGRTHTSAIEICIMAADFEDGARMWVSRRYQKSCSTVPNCSYLATQRLWDIPVAPRRIECFYTSQDGQFETSAWADAPSERLHFSVRRWF